MPIDPNTGLPITTSSSNLPGYLQQQSTPGITGGIDNMLRALLASQYAPKNSSGSTGGFNNAAFAGQQSNVQGMPQSQPGMMDSGMGALFTQPPATQPQQWGNHTGPLPINAYGAMPYGADLSNTPPDASLLFNLPSSGFGAQ